jgi:hypothetical protein
MKKHLLALIILFSCITVMAQIKAKPKEKAPTQNEVQNMMKELQKAMDEISPEDKKAMEDMGYKLPSTTSIPILTDEQLQAGADELSIIVPKRDVARIASIPKNLNDSRMNAYITAVQSSASLLLKPEIKSMGDKIYSYIKSNSKNSSEAGNMANGLWMAGKPEIAIYTLGKICADEPTNTDNLSNYASMLSMLGAQHIAIPILNNLNAKFKGNSTLLNNLGQAWFGLGEINKAEKYLDSTIRICAYHPQANYTKSFIEESKGNTKAAIESARRSIKSGYSNEKDNRLYKLGYDLDRKDIDWNKPMPQDPLGLEKFHWPAFPKSVSSSIQLKEEWEAFSEAIAKEDDLLESQQEKLEDASATISEARQQQLIKASRTGKGGSIFPPLAYKAFKKLKYLVDDNDGQLIFSMDKKTKAIISAIDEVENLSQLLSEKYKTLNERYQPQFGEGKANPFDAACSDYNGAADGFLNSANALLEQTQNDYLDDLRRYLNNQIYYDQYTMWPEQFELAKVIAKRKWLAAINQKVMFKDPSYYCQEKEEIKPGKGKLQDFDDVACRYKSTMDLKIITFKNDCSRMTSTFDFMFLKYVRKDDFERAEGDTYISSTYKISAEEGLKEYKKGPLKVEAKIGGGIEFEFGRQGLEDVTIIAEVKVGAGTGILDEDEETGSTGIGIAGKDAFPTTYEAGVEGRISILSGKGSVSGTGVLENIEITKW